MLRYEARSAADAETAWTVMSRPDRWHEWAPHIRGAHGLGDPEVRRGARGVVRVLGLPVVPARITDVRRPDFWSWRVGPMELDHRVVPQEDGGCVVGVDIRSAAALEPVLAVTYGPVVSLLVKRLARVAETA